MVGFEKKKQQQEFFDISFHIDIHIHTFKHVYVCVYTYTYVNMTVGIFTYSYIIVHIRIIHTEMVGFEKKKQQQESFYVSFHKLKSIFIH
jgi:hypothetical protein